MRILEQRAARRAARLLAAAAAAPLVAIPEPAASAAPLVTIPEPAPSAIPDSIGLSPAAVPASGAAASSPVLYFETVRTPGKIVQFIVPPLLGSPAIDVLTSVNPRARMKLCKLPKTLLSKSPGRVVSPSLVPPTLPTSESDNNPPTLFAATLAHIESETSPQFHASLPALVIPPALCNLETQTSPRLTSSETQTSPRLLDPVTLQDLKNEIRLLVIGLGF